MVASLDLRPTPRRQSLRLKLRPKILNKMIRKLRRLRMQLVRELMRPQQAVEPQPRNIKIIQQREEVVQPSRAIIIIITLEKTNLIRITIKEEVAGANLSK